MLKKFPDAIERKKTEDVDREYDLASYDVIVAFDPDWLQLDADQMKLLKTWVEGGGGLVVVAGPVNTSPLSRKANAEKLQPILDLYPVAPGDNRLDDLDRTADQPFALHFPGADKAPAFLNLDPEGKGPLAGWDEFFYGTHGDVKNPELKRRLLRRLSGGFRQADRDRVGDDRRPEGSAGQRPGKAVPRRADRRQGPRRLPRFE